MPPLSDKMMELVARRFRMLGEPLRLRLLQLLEGGEQTVGDLGLQLNASQPNISRHLQAMYDAGLLSRRREGNRILYSIADPVIFKICHLVCQSAAKDAQEHFTAVTQRRVRSRPAGQENRK